MECNRMELKIFKFQLADFQKKKKFIATKAWK